MAKSGPAGRPRASRWEILGARLRIWTPPRDVEIPPVSRRAVALSVAGLALAAAVVVTLIAPAIDRDKERTAAQQRRDRIAFVARERTRLTAVQRARHARAPPVARLHAAGREAQARTALLTDARAHVERDARRRVAAGELDGPIREVSCDYYRTREPGPRVHLRCLASTAPRIVHKGRRVSIGHPYIVGGSLRDGRYAWCKDNPRPGEGSIGQSVSVELPGTCTR